MNEMGLRFNKVVKFENLEFRRKKNDSFVLKYCALEHTGRLILEFVLKLKNGVFLHCKAF